MPGRKPGRRSAWPLPPSHVTHPTSEPARSRVAGNRGRRRYAASSAAACPAGRGRGGKAFHFNAVRRRARHPWGPNGVPVCSSAWGLWRSLAMGSPGDGTRGPYFVSVAGIAVCSPRAGAPRRCSLPAWQGRSRAMGDAPGLPERLGDALPRPCANGPWRTILRVRGSEPRCHELGGGCETWHRGKLCSYKRGYRRRFCPRCGTKGAFSRQFDQDWLTEPGVCRTQRAGWGGSGPPGPALRPDSGGTEPDRDGRAQQVRLTRRLRQGRCRPWARAGRSEGESSARSARPRGGSRDLPSSRGS